MKIKSINKIKNLSSDHTDWFKSISAQEKKPLDKINVTEVLMHLDWPRMNYFDDQNKVVDPKINDGRVVFMGNSITQGWSQYMPEMFDNQTILTGE